MFRSFPNSERSLHSLLNLIKDLIADGLLFFRLLFRSRTARSAEVLFLRKQLAFYEERQVQPRRLNDSARFSLILWSRLCNWKEALVIVKPETLIGWHRKGFQLLWKWKSRVGRPRLPESIRKLIVHGTRESDLRTSPCGSGAVGEAEYLCFSTYSARLLVSRTGATRPSEDLFAELEDVCPQSRPVHRRLRFSGRGDRPVPNSLCIPPDGGWHKAHCALQRHRASTGSLDLAAAARSDPERSFPTVS